MNSFLYNEFVFSPRYRVWRHITYWTFHIMIWSTFWFIMVSPASFGRQVINMVMWVPAFILFGYPLVYLAIPHLLLKGKFLQFFLVILGWGAVGLYIDSGYRSFVLIPLQEAMHLKNILPRGNLPACYLCMTTSAASPMIIKFFKLLTLKQKAWVQTREEKATAELQLLKAQVHPHFLFNTLNNIYYFSMDNSPETPGLILKLSSLLNYILHDCKADEVKLEKEIDIMKNYIDLEKTRYGSKISISWNVEGISKSQLIAPVLMLPFLENAFKHGTSEQIEKSWINVYISVKQNRLSFQIANSKNDYVEFRHNGIGIVNVKKRLALIYPDSHELQLSDEGNFFTVTLLINLTDKLMQDIESLVSVSYLSNEQQAEHLAAT
jgi:two-component system, LytTR family, sensor histidine kinase AlgZ